MLEKKKRLEHWVGHWEQLEWSPLGGWIPSAHIVPLEDESARGDRSKELKILRMRKHTCDTFLNPNQEIWNFWLGNVCLVLGGFHVANFGLFYQS